MPIIPQKYADIFLIHRKERHSGVDGELRGASSESPNLSGWKAHPLEQERAAVTLNRRDIQDLRLAGRVEHWLIIGIQFWRQPARECVTSAEVDRRSIVQRCRSRTHTEAQRVSVMSDRRVILQLVRIERVEGVSDL